MGSSFDTKLIRETLENDQRDMKIEEYIPQAQDNQFKSVIAGDTNGVAMIVVNGIVAGLIGGFACAFIGNGKLTLPIFMGASFVARAGLGGWRGNAAFVIAMIVAVITNAIAGPLAK